MTKMVKVYLLIYIGNINRKGKLEGFEQMASRHKRKFLERKLAKLASSR